MVLHLKKNKKFFAPQRQVVALLGQPGTKTQEDRTEIIARADGEVRGVHKSLSIFMVMILAAFSLQAMIWEEDSKNHPPLTLSLSLPSRSLQINNHQS